MTMAIPVDSDVDSAVSVCLSSIVEIVLITSFTMTSCQPGTTNDMFDFFCNVYFSPILPSKCFYVLSFREMASTGLICCDPWKDIYYL